MSDSKHTFGDSQASINLIDNILAKPEYIKTRSKVFRLLARQLQAFAVIVAIPDEKVRLATLRMWHDKFAAKVAELPEIVRTHTLCVETGQYRKRLREVRFGNNGEGHSMDGEETAMAKPTLITG